MNEIKTLFHLLWKVFGQIWLLDSHAKEVFENLKAAKVQVMNMLHVQITLKENVE